ncbi:reverse transcriptase domain-containing protein [Tanacetum coccineum]
MWRRKGYAAGASKLGKKETTKHFKPIHYASKTMNEVQENYTTTEKELLAVVFAFEKFRQTCLSKTIVSRTFCPSVSNSQNKSKTTPNLIDFAYLVILISKSVIREVTKILQPTISLDLKPDLGRLTRADIETLFLEDDNGSLRQEIMNPTVQILQHCHSRPSEGHHGIATTARKVFEAMFYWPHVFRDAQKLVQVCDACQRALETIP